MSGVDRPSPPCGARFDSPSHRAPCGRRRCRAVQASGGSGGRRRGRGQRESFSGGARAFPPEGTPLRLRQRGAWAPAGPEGAPDRAAGLLALPGPSAQSNCPSPAGPARLSWPHLHGPSRAAALGRSRVRVRGLPPRSGPGKLASCSAARPSASRPALGSRKQSPCGRLRSVPRLAPRPRGSGTGGQWVSLSPALACDWPEGVCPEYLLLF